MNAQRITRRRTAESSVHPAVPGIAALGLSLGFLFAALSGQFSVRQVQVVGANLPVAAIQQASGVEGANIFSVRSDQVVARLSSVRSIAVRRVDVSFPDRVTVYARLRRAMAAWKTSSGLYVLDPEGRIIQSVKQTTLPIITSTQRGGSLGPGIVEAVREATVLLPREPNGAIASFTYDGRTGLTITGKSGWRAIIGLGSRRTLVNRVATMAAILAKAQKEGRTFTKADLRYKDPYIT